MQASLARIQDKGRRDESEAESGRRSDVENFICCVFLMFVEQLGRHISGRGGGYAVGPSLGFLRKVSLCSGLRVGNSGDAQLRNHFHLQVNRSGEPSDKTK